MPQTARAPALTTPAAQEDAIVVDVRDCKNSPSHRLLQVTATTAGHHRQLRAAVSADAVAEYAEAQKGGAIFPSIHDGTRYWLADGFHRFEAHQEAGLPEISAEIRKGGRRDAVLHAAGANANHGLRRTQEDKRKSITAFLTDPEWRTWSDKEIAWRTGTSDKTVAKARRDLSGEAVDAEIRVEERTLKVTQRRGGHGLLDRVLRGLPDDVLLAEVRRRGLVEGV